MSLYWIFYSLTIFWLIPIEGIMFGQCFNNNRFDQLLIMVFCFSYFRSRWEEKRIIWICWGFIFSDRVTIACVEEKELAWKQPRAGNFPVVLKSFFGFVFPFSYCYGSSSNRNNSSEIMRLITIAGIYRVLHYNAGDARDCSIPGWGRSCGGGNGNPLQYSCPGNLMDREAWRATAHGVAISWTQLSTYAFTEY